jgi:hypothetical protein
MLRPVDDSVYVTAVAGSRRVGACEDKRVRIRQNEKDRENGKYRSLHNDSSPSRQIVRFYRQVGVPAVSALIGKWPIRWPGSHKLNAAPDSWYTFRRYMNNFTINRDLRQVHARRWPGERWFDRSERSVPNTRLTPCDAKRKLGILDGEKTILTASGEEMKAAR